MAKVTNPFEDSFSDDRNANQPSTMITSTNPFDEDVSNAISNKDTRSIGLGLNPFDEQADENDDGEDETFETKDEENIVGAPVEASWQYLGDLPYRRIPIYSNVLWGGNMKEFGSKSGDTGRSTQNLNYGLSAFPRAAIQRHPDLLDARELKELLNTSTVTKVVGCQYGGPIAAVTLPIVGETSWFSYTDIRIMTNSGYPLATIEFPIPEIEQKYSPSDIIEIGFTDRAILIIVLKDSLCLTYGLTGEVILPPFFILPRGEGQGTDLLHACIFEGGAAVLSISKHSAIVEFLDEHDDPAYFNSAHLGSRKILPHSSVSTDSEPIGLNDSVPPFCGIITFLPTATFASSNFLSYAAIAVLPRTMTVSRHPEVFLSTNDNSVVVVDVATTEIKDLNCRSRISSPIVEMIFAPNGRFLACFTESSILTVISSTFETKVLDFDFSEGSTQPPLEIRWCGEDSVVLHWKNLGIVMVGPYGDWLRFPYENNGNLYLIPEVDSCRVVSDVSVELLQRVPPATALLLRIGSIEPAAMLLDASDAFDNGSTTSDEAARAITKTGMLLEAIEGCTEAAAREFDIETQKRLLRAASYGMHFLFKNSKGSRNIMGGNLQKEANESAHTMPSQITAKFVQTAKKLRIMNALRNPIVGIVLTSAQYDALSPIGIIARLVAVEKPALGASISKYLCLPKSVQLYARASKAASFVVSSKDHLDAKVAEDVVRIITEGKCGSAEGSKYSSSIINRGGYATVAMASMKAGRPGVANILLQLETSVSDKIPALLLIGAHADAVSVAASARDSDFIFYTMMQYQKHCMVQYKDGVKGNQNFLAALATKFPLEAYNALRKYNATIIEVKQEISLQIRRQQFIDAGITIAKRALDGKTETRGKQAILSESSKIFAMGKDASFYKTCTDEYIELLKDQDILRKKYSSSEVAPESSSAVATIMSILHYASKNDRDKNRLLNDADKVAKKFRVPEKVLWHTKVKAFSESKQWKNLLLLSNSRTKSPIGYKPFARAAIKGCQPDKDILRYIERISIPEERFSLYAEACLWRRAMDEAVKMKDARRIMDVKARCNDHEIQLAANQMLARLQ